MGISAHMCGLHFFSLQPSQGCQGFGSSAARCMDHGCHVLGMSLCLPGCEIEFIIPGHSICSLFSSDVNISTLF